MKFRRVGLPIFIALVLFSIIITNIEKGSTVDSKASIIEGTVTNIVSSKKCKQYYIGNCMASDMSRNNREIYIGDIVRVYGEYNNLNDFYIKDFNYGRYLKSKGIKINIKTEKIEIIGENGFFKYIGMLKSEFSDINNYLYKENADILNAMTLGIKDNLEKDLRYIFLDSGTSHIMAISGLHISIILYMIIVIFGEITNIKKLISIIVVLGLYSILVAGGASVNRAIELSILSCMAFLIDERVDTINLVFIIASLMVIENIYIIYNISFQLSFLAILSISIFNKYIKKFVYSNIVSVTVSSNILTIPIVAYSFKEISLVSLVGNIIIIPFIGIIIFLDLLSIAIYHISIELAMIIAYINSSIISSILFLLKKIGNFGVNNITFKNINLYKVVFYYFIIALLIIGLEIYMIEKNRYKLSENKINKKYK